MKHENKLTPTEQGQLEAQQQQTRSSAAQEFATPEEMLRHDALHTPVPPAIAHRLQESIDKVPPPRQSWWRRLLGGSNQ
jgi:hypothetical protein